IGTVILPSLSKNHATQTQEEFSRTMDWGVRLVVLLAVPAAVALLVLAKVLLASLFFYGEFSLVDVEQSAKALQAYSLGLLAFMLIIVFVPVFFFRLDNLTPV